jgi:surface antigen
LSSKYNVTIDSIIWANESLKKSAKLKVWSTINIPPVSGLIHEVEESESIDSLARKYKISKDKIISQNSIDWELALWETLIIPWATKYNPKNTYSTTYNGKGSTYWFSKSWQSKYVNGWDYAYKLVRRKPKHTFVWWNCTRFIGQYKDVTWWGNAKDWLKNAKAKGAETWKDPKAGAIIVFFGKGYNPWYGHVAIVVDVKDDSLIVKDMNYRRLNEVTTREIPKNDRAISGYIYVP